MPLVFLANNASWIYCHLSREITTFFVKCMCIISWYGWLFKALFLLINFYKKVRMHFCDLFTILIFYLNALFILLLVILCACFQRLYYSLDLQCTREGSCLWRWSCWKVSRAWVHYTHRGLTHRLAHRWMCCLFEESGSLWVWPGWLYSSAQLLQSFSLFASWLTWVEELSATMPFNHAGFALEAANLHGVTPLKLWSKRTFLSNWVC